MLSSTHQKPMLMLPQRPDSIESAAKTIVLFQQPTVAVAATDPHRAGLDTTATTTTTTTTISSCGLSASTTQSPPHGSTVTTLTTTTAAKFHQRDNDDHHHHHHHSEPPMPSPPLRRHNSTAAAVATQYQKHDQQKGGGMKRCRSPNHHRDTALMVVVVGAAATYEQQQQHNQEPKTKKFKADFRGHDDNDDITRNNAATNLSLQLPKSSGTSINNNHCQQPRRRQRQRQQSQLFQPCNLVDLSVDDDVIDGERSHGKDDAVTASAAIAMDTAIQTTASCFEWSDCHHHRHQRVAAIATGGTTRKKTTTASAEAQQQQQQIIPLPLLSPPYRPATLSDRVGIRSSEMRFIDAIAQRLTGRPQLVFKTIAAWAIGRHNARRPEDGTAYDNLPKAILRLVRENMEPVDYMAAYAAAWKGWNNDAATTTTTAHSTITNAAVLTTSQSSDDLGRETTWSTPPLPPQKQTSTTQGPLAVAVAGPQPTCTSATMNFPCVAPPQSAATTTATKNYSPLSVAFAAAAAAATVPKATLLLCVPTTTTMVAARVPAAVTVPIKTAMKNGTAAALAPKRSAAPLPTTPNNSIATTGTPVPPITIATLRQSVGAAYPFQRHAVIPNDRHRSDFAASHRDRHQKQQQQQKQRHQQKDLYNYHHRLIPSPVVAKKKKKYFVPLNPPLRVTTTDRWGMAFPSELELPTTWPQQRGGMLSTSVFHEPQPPICHPPRQQQRPSQRAPVLGRVSRTLQRQAAAANGSRTQIPATNNSTSSESNMQLALRYGFALCLHQQQKRRMNQQRGTTVVVEAMEDILEKAERKLRVMTKEELAALWDEIAAYATIVSP